MKKSGQLTVFLSLILIIMISFVMTVLRYALVHISADEAYAASELSVESLFGEFSRAALEAGDILTIDGSFMAGEYNEDKLLEHYKDYVVTMTEKPEGFGLGVFGYPGTGCKLEDAGVTGVELMTDNGGAAIREQLAAYMEDASGLSAIEDILNISGDGDDWESRAEADLNESENRVPEMLEEAITSTDRTIDSPTADDDPAADDENMSIPANSGGYMTVRSSGTGLENWILSSLGKAALSLVTDGYDLISGNEVNESELISQRRASGKMRKGYGATERIPDPHELSQKMLFYGYLSRELAFRGSSESDIGRTHESRPLLYEMEYIIGGRTSDRENLELVSEKLMLLRTGQNLTVLMTSPELTAEVNAVTDAVCLAIPVPGISLLVKAVVYTAWAVAESAAEISLLYDGDKMPLIKTAADWKTRGIGLESLTEQFLKGNISPEGYMTESVNRSAGTTALSPAATAGSDGASGTGLDYRSWLTVLIMLQDTELSTFRFADLVEIRAHQIEGNDSFKMDNCIESLTIRNRWRLSDGRGYEFDMSYCYR